MSRPKKPIDLEEMSKLCAIQCTDEEIAAFFDVSVRTIERRKKNKQFNEFLARGRAKGRASLRRLQWQTAQSSGRGAVTMQIWLGKQLLGQKESAHYEHSGPSGGPVNIEDVRIKLARLIERRAEAHQDAGKLAREN